jgi:hypothetical protein
MKVCCPLLAEAADMTPRSGGSATRHEGPGKHAGSLQRLMAYIRENPADGRELIRL